MMFERNTMRSQTSGRVNRTRISAMPSAYAVLISAGLLDRVRRCHLARATLVAPRLATSPTYGLIRSRAAFTTERSQA